MKPNVVLIMVDQMRADCLSILDHPIVDTPNIDQLARQGVVFKQAHSATPTCVPARASLLTGMSQASTGRVGYEDKVPWNYENFLPESFQKAGYHTQAIGKMHVYPARKLCGFHHIELHDGYLHYNRNQHEAKVGESYEAVDDYLNWLRERAGHHLDLTDLGLDCNSSTVARPWTLPEELHPTNWVVTRSIDFLRRRDPTKPFFLNMSFVRPHPPFDPPEFFYNMYKDLEFPDPPIGDWATEEDPDRSGHNPITGKGRVPKRRLHQAQAAYYALITHIDHQIGRFKMKLAEYGLDRNTIILFASDHGELLGDHHLFRKSLPYEGSTKVPLIVSDPTHSFDFKKNQQLDHVTEMRDIMPTLLDIADIEIPDTVEGKSLYPLMQNKDIKWRDYLHGEHEQLLDSHHYITTGKDKYIWYSQTGTEQYFDLEEDPEELINQIDNEVYASEIDHLRGLLIKELADREEGFTDGETLFAYRHVKPTLDHARE